MNPTKRQSIEAGKAVAAAASMLLKLAPVKAKYLQGQWYIFDEPNKKYYRADWNGEIFFTEVDRWMVKL